MDVPEAIPDLAVIGGVGVVVGLGDTGGVGTELPAGTDLLELAVERQERLVRPRPPDPG